MKRIEYYDDFRYCPTCIRYVRYLRAWQVAYCVECDGIVQIFSPDDLVDIRAPRRAELELSD